MSHLWITNAEEMCEIYEIAEKLGRKPGESIEDIFLAYMQIKGKKSVGMTELNKSELISQIISNSKTVLSINIDEKGESSYGFIKKSE